MCFKILSVKCSVGNTSDHQKVAHRIEGPDFGKILRRSYDNLRIFVQYMLILRQIYNITTIVRTLLTL